MEANGFGMLSGVELLQILAMSQMSRSRAKDSLERALKEIEKLDNKGFNDLAGGMHIKGGKPDNSVL